MGPPPAAWRDKWGHREGHIGGTRDVTTPASLQPSHHIFESTVLGSAPHTMAPRSLLSVCPALWPQPPAAPALALLCFPFPISISPLPGLVSLSQTHFPHFPPQFWHPTLVSPSFLPFSDTVSPAYPQFPSSPPQLLLSHLTAFLPVLPFLPQFPPFLLSPLGSPGDHSPLVPIAPPLQHPVPKLGLEGPLEDPRTPHVDVESLTEPWGGDRGS